MVFSVVVLFLWTRRGAWCLVSGEEDRRSCSISGMTDEEGGSCYGKEKRFSEVLGERTKRRGVWLVIPLERRWSCWLIRHLEVVFFAPGVGSSLKEGVFAWVKV